VRCKEPAKGAGEVKNVGFNFLRPGFSPHELYHGSEGNRVISTRKALESDVGKRVCDLIKYLPTVKDDIK
jgi:hypothetical protein